MQVRSGKLAIYTGALSRGLSAVTACMETTAAAQKKVRRNFMVQWEQRAMENKL